MDQAAYRDLRAGGMIKVDGVWFDVLNRKDEKGRARLILKRLSGRALFCIYLSPDGSLSKLQSHGCLTEEQSRYCIADLIAVMAGMQLV